MIQRWMASAMVALALVGSGCAGSYDQTYVRAPARMPGSAVSVGYFYDELASYGRWIEYPGYGWVWTPYDAAPGWRPYTYGSWVATDLGWAWASSEPWGWATYHYGRWHFDGTYGWLWVPGTVWAPAWVAWHYSDDWVGWAPLPPHGTVNVTVPAGDSQTIPPYHWAFVQRRDLADNNLSSRVVSTARNATLLQTQPRGVLLEEGVGRRAEPGPDVGEVEKWTGRKIARQRVVEVESPSRGRGQSVGSGTVGFFRPRFDESDTRQAPPPRVQQREVAVSEPVLRRQQEMERRRLEAVLANERARLEREHARELRYQPPGTAVDQIRSRQAAEKQAFEAQVIEQRRVLQERQKMKVAKPARARSVDRPGPRNEENRKKGDRGEG